MSFWWGIMERAAGWKSWYFVEFYILGFCVTRMISDMKYTISP